MKKNLIIGILSVVSVLSMGFAYYQRTIARRCEIIAVESVRRAEEMNRVAREARIMAEQQRAMAEMNAMEANKQMQIAIEQSRLAMVNAKKMKH